MKQIEQISQSNGHYIAGFVDGEGSFNISFKHRQDYNLGVKISASFNISQKEIEILEWIKSIFKCGTIRSRNDGLFYYEVTDLTSLNERIIPFFDKFGLRTKKYKAFIVFKRIISLMIDNFHKKPEGILEIYDLREQVKVSRKRKYSREEIFNFIKTSRNLSSETIRQTLRNENYIEMT